MRNDVTLRDAPRAPCSAVTPATACTIDQFSSLLTETSKRASSNSWKFKYLHEPKAVAGATSLQGRLRPHRDTMVVGSESRAHVASAPNTVYAWVWGEPDVISMAISSAIRRAISST